MSNDETIFFLKDGRLQSEYIPVKSREKVLSDDTRRRPSSRTSEKDLNGSKTAVSPGQTALETFIELYIDKIGENSERPESCGRSGCAEPDTDFKQDHRIPDALWERIHIFIPPKQERTGPGRPREPDRKMMEAIYYLLRTGCQWNEIPRDLGAKSTVHDRFTEWIREGVFFNMWKAGLMEYDARRGIQWTWQSMDGCITKSPLGGGATGPNPTDRRKCGTKRSLLTDGAGIPIGMAVSGANRNDMIVAPATLDSIAVVRPSASSDEPQNLCLDAGYDYAKIRSLAEDFGYTHHIRTRNEERDAKIRIPGYRARRWVVERTHSWMNRFRRMLIRWEKKAENYLAMICMACAWIAFRAAGVQM